MDGSTQHAPGLQETTLQDGQASKPDDGRIPLLDIARIMQDIPHRYPMLLLDRMVDLIPHVSATGIKNVTANEHFFQGHFPGHPVMPGVMIIEVMAQTSAVLVVESLGREEAAGKLVYFMTVAEGFLQRE